MFQQQLNSITLPDFSQKLMRKLAILRHRTSFPNIFFALRGDSRKLEQLPEKFLSFSSIDDSGMIWFIASLSPVPLSLQKKSTKKINALRRNVFFALKSKLLFVCKTLFDEGISNKGFFRENLLHTHMAQLFILAHYCGTDTKMHM